MILIEKIVWCEIDDKIFVNRDFAPFESVRVRSMYGRCEGRDPRILTEYVHGRKFKRDDGVVVNIGMTREAQDVMGVQYDEWERLLEEYGAVLASNTCLAQQLENINTACFWTRLKALFFGYKSARGHDGKH